MSEQTKRAAKFSLEEGWEGKVWGGTAGPETLGGQGPTAAKAEAAGALQKLSRPQNKAQRNALSFFSLYLT